MRSPPHQSGHNTASYSRRSLYRTYNAARAGDVAAPYYAAYKKRIQTSGEGKFFL
jgi:hypothetical protein